MDQNLFLLEFQITNINVEESCICEPSPGQTSITFEFPGQNSTEIIQKNPKNCQEKAGKTCLFPLTQHQQDEASKNFKIKLFLCKKHPESNEQTEIGTSVIPISNLFKNLTNKEVKTLNDSFIVVNSVGAVVGEVGVFLRLSCFGKMITTDFKMDFEEDKPNKSLCQLYKNTSCEKEPNQDKSACELYKKKSDGPGERFQEIGAMMGQNSLLIKIREEEQEDCVDNDKEKCVIKIGKKGDNKGNLELELCTPKLPVKKPIPKLETRDTQYSLTDCKPETPVGAEGGQKEKKDAKKGDKKLVKGKEAKKKK